MARNHIKGTNKRKGSNKATGRNYAYDKAYESSPEQIRKRAARNAARRRMISMHGKSALKGKDVDHSNSNPLDNRTSNLKIMSKKENRGKTRNGRRV